MNVVRILPFVAVLLVVAVVSGAFVVMGPPSLARARALDRRRVDDLRSIADQLYARYSAAKTPLPQRLGDDKRDPVTQAPYQYRRFDATHYQLCATFQLAGDPDADVFVGKRWHHTAGRTCYRFDVRVSPLLS